MDDPALPDAAAEPYRPAVGRTPPSREGSQGELQAMTLIDIFKENHRSSEKTPHPAPHSVVGATNLAADCRRKQPRDFCNL
jgi:hypothetical protein